MNTPSDIELLRRFEPIIRYTKGESFFPMSIGRYIQKSSLWVYRPNQPLRRIWGDGDLSLARLSQPRSHGPGAIYYLKFIDPLSLTDMLAYQIEQVREGITGQAEDVFRAGRGRLARVGYISRFVDGLFSLSLLARGRVPGDTAVAAARAYKQMMAQQEEYHYYGRVVHKNGWIALQYWFFYAYNNWRSGFYGANDHESDWEMIYIYLYEDDNGQLCPAWVAYASHDFAGDDLRRRWDDPEVEKIGEHPIIYAGAGSHASYFQRGEYLAELVLPFISPVVKVVDDIQKWWEARLRTYIGENENRRKWSSFSIFRVPFVDYARGDGLSIGPGQEKQWSEPNLLMPTPDWASQYRGLWGFYARDPLSGENAPAGPVYNRDGTQRRSWYDPLGWSGLDKVTPPNRQLAEIEQRLHELDEQWQMLTAEISRKTVLLNKLGLEADAMQAQSHLKVQLRERQREIDSLSELLSELREERATNEATVEALQRHAEHIRSGERGPLRAHINHAHTPTSSEELRLSQFAETWAAVSIGIMVLGFVILAIFAPDYLLLGFFSLVMLFITIEAAFRRRITQLINWVTIVLAIISAVILLIEFWDEALVVAVLLAGGYITWENLRELRR
ncbi:MAG: hypothetical protein H6658_10615 [Ardenticatenaceae bacterium]|nr:hypothetical protein [Ardenticatenaceae bacterium]